MDLPESGIAWNGVGRGRNLREELKTVNVEGQSVFPLQRGLYVDGF